MAENHFTHEIIFINDGSTDRSWAVIEDLASKDSCVHGIKFRRNYGKSPALFCGFRAAQGQVVITMDADLQDPPEVALLMIEKWKEGYDVVHGRRKSRQKESIFKKLTANGLLYYQN